MLGQHDRKAAARFRSAGDEKDIKKVLKKNKKTRDALTPPKFADVSTKAGKVRSKMGASQSTKIPQSDKARKTNETKAKQSDTLHKQTKKKYSKSTTDFMGNDRDARARRVANKTSKDPDYKRSNNQLTRAKKAGQSIAKDW